jgi:hypothetical protein
LMAMDEALALADAYKAFPRKLPTALEGEAL